MVHARRIDGDELLGAAVDRADVLDPPVGVAAGRADRHRVRRERGHRPARVVVDAHHRSVCVRWGFGVEQPRLGVEVVLHRRMEVQMVARQVGEAADREVARRRRGPRVSAWLDTSITTVSTPCSTITASSACRSGASGVVSALGWSRPSIRMPTVPIRPATRSAARRPASTRYVVVVLPDVPVTPITRSCSDGLP